MKDVHIVGLDEVGWGALAGPIVVCAASVPLGKWDVLRQWGVRDSKKFVRSKKDNAPLQRPHRLFDARKNIHKLALELENKGDGLATWSIACCDVYDIERETPSSAKNRIARSAIYRLCFTNKWDILTDIEVIMDGGESIISLPSLIPQQPVTRADCRILPVSVASILAKSYRDKLMLGLHKRYPHYGFNTNMGYNSLTHIKALIKYGPIVGIHRLGPSVKAVENYILRLNRKKTRFPRWLTELKEQLNM